MRYQPHVIPWHMNVIQCHRLSTQHRLVVTRDHQRSTPCRLRVTRDHEESKQRRLRVTRDHEASVVSATLAVYGLTVDPGSQGR
jgi:hypothetical protein